MSINDHQQAVEWARRILNDPATIILDTETTGLDDRAEICQVAAINLAGATLFNSLVRTNRAIPPAATAIHGITNQATANAPTWLEVEKPLLSVVLGYNLVIYNAGYDLRLIQQSYQAAGVYLLPPPLIVAPHSVLCAMHWYSQWCGEWNDYHGNYRWQRLPGGDHSALGDCLATLKVIQLMAEG